MASKRSVTIKQHEGAITFTPYLGTAGQPLGVNTGDLVTWTNETNDKITLKSIQPPDVFLCEPIPEGEVSDPIFIVTQTAGTYIGYSWVRRSAPPPAQPDAWIVVVPVKE
jgi:hypothetical protein